MARISICLILISFHFRSMLSPWSNVRFSFRSRLIRLDSKIQMRTARSVEVKKEWWFRPWMATHITVQSEISSISVRWNILCSVNSMNGFLILVSWLEWISRFSNDLLCSPSSTLYPVLFMSYHYSRSNSNHKLRHDRGKNHLNEQFINAHGVQSHQRLNTNQPVIITCHHRTAAWLIQQQSTKYHLYQSSLNSKAINQHRSEN